MTFTATRSQERSPTNRQSANETFWRVVTRGFALIGWFIFHIVFSVFWHLIGSEQLSYFSQIRQFAFL